MSEFVHITKHAMERCEERLGLSAKAAERMATKAWLAGLKHADTTGALNRYISKLYWQHQNANNVRIYGEHVYIFCHERLVTILQLPHAFRNTVRILFAARSKTQKPKRTTNYFSDDNND